MSTSSTYVKWAAVTFDFAILSKIRLRKPGIGIRSSAPLGVTATAGAGAAAAPMAGPRAALRTSSSVRRPCGPLPRTAARFTFSSFARRRTAGAARTSPEGTGTEGTGGDPDLVAGAGGSGDRMGGAGIGPGTSPASPNTTSVLPTFTTSPSFARSWRILPVTGEGIWTVTLSVMTSTIGSFSLTASPSLTNHLTTSPSWTPSPMSGSLNSRAMVTAGRKEMSFLITFRTFHGFVETTKFDGKAGAADRSATRGRPLSLGPSLHLPWLPAHAGVVQRERGWQPFVRAPRFAAPPSARSRLRRVLSRPLVVGIRRHDRNGNRIGVSSPRRIRPHAQPAFNYPLWFHSTCGIAGDSGPPLGGAGIHPPGWTPTTSACLTELDPGFSRVLRGIRAKDRSAGRVAKRQAWKLSHGPKEAFLWPEANACSGRSRVVEEWHRPVGVICARRSAPEVSRPAPPFCG